MKIIVAKTAGFCFGVNRAVDMVDKLLTGGHRVATLGPIIHNGRLVLALSKKGARVIESVGEAHSDEVVVVRSHGISRSAYDEISGSGLEVCDATCPFVSKIHKLVTGVDPDTGVLIAGDKTHPEVLGITGHCRGDFYVFADEEELKNCPFYREKPLIMVAQTTYNEEKWIKCTRIAKEHYTNLKIFDTICNATSMRQNEAGELSKTCDTMLVVGDPGSSNTCKLFEICARNCRAYLIEGADELKKEMFLGARKVGITAGASTPAFIIKEVLETMNAFEQETDVEEFSFEEALEQSLKTAHTNQKVVGTVTGIAPNEVQVDIGTKHAGYIPISELSDDPSVKPEDILAKGDKINVVVLKVNDAEGTVMLSKKRFDALEGYDRVSDASKDGTVLSGVVTDVVKGGVIVLTNGVRVFVPASQATISKNDQLDDLKGQNVSLRIIEMGKGRRSIIGSIRSVLMDERNKMRDEFWDTVEVGQTYKGPVKSTTSYGAFIDLGGVDGMVHISELSWKRIKNPSEVVKVGDVLEVYVKDIDKEKKKISLGFKKMEDNPWEVLKKSHEIGDVVEGKVVSLTQFGAFVNIMDGIDGLVHISQIAQERVEKASDVLKKGQEVKAKILDIDYDKKRVSLSIKALLDETPDAMVSESAEEVSEEE